jgi:DNA-directed RNA polymerase subunit RPC12/RpoP
MLRCCKCGKTYDFAPQQGKLYLPVIECPHCGYRHTVEFKPVEDASPLVPVQELRLTAAKPVLIANRLLSATRVALANDNTDVADYNKANEFIVAFQIDEEKGPWNAVYILQWRNVTDGGSFDTIGTVGEMVWGTATDLVNEAAITTKACQASGGSGSTWQNGREVEGDWASLAINLADEAYTEIHFAVDPSGALGGKQYEFQLYDFTNGAAIGTGAAAVTIASATQKTLVDSGSGVDAQTIQATPSLADSGSGADAQVVAATLALAETGAGADVLSVVQQVLVALSDSGAGDDAVATLLSSLVVTDAGSGADLIAALQSALVIADSGEGSDVLAALQAALALAESGSGADLVSVLSASLAILDSGSGTDAMSLDIQESGEKTLADSGSGTDILILAVASLLTDSGSGVDQQTILADIFL